MCCIVIAALCVYEGMYVLQQSPYDGGRTAIGLPVERVSARLCQQIPSGPQLVGKALLQCAFLYMLPLEERPDRPQHIDIADHTYQLSSVGCQHWHCANVLLQQDVQQCRPRRVREHRQHV